MSKSYRRPYSTVGGHNSAKKDKQQASRCWRRLQNKMLKKALDWEGFVNPLRYEASGNDVWGWNRDGRQTLQRVTGRDLSDQERYERVVKWVEECKRK